MGEQSFGFQQGDRALDTAETLVGSWITGRYRGGSPELADLNMVRLNQILNRLDPTDADMILSVMLPQPDLSLRGLCLNLLNRRLDPRVVIHNTVHLMSRFNRLGTEIDSSVIHETVGSVQGLIGEMPEPERLRIYAKAFADEDRNKPEEGLTEFPA